MRVGKKNNKGKSYAIGGVVSAIAGLGQAGLGVYQMVQGQKMAKDIKEASTARPSEYAQLLKEAQGAKLEKRRIEQLNRSLATGVGAAGAAGGRALIGALPGMVQAGQAGALAAAGQRQQDIMQATQFAARGSEMEIQRNMQREMMQRQAAQAAIEGGLQNIGGGLGQIGKAAIFGAFDMGAGKIKAAGGAADALGQYKPDVMYSLGQTAGERQSIASGLGDLWEQRDALGFEQGGKMTKGAFNHKTNPIDIVQSGKKVGEMTGGEVILNPSQQKKLSKESAYFRSLLKKFNKQK